MKGSIHLEPTSQPFTNSLEATRIASGEGSRRSFFRAASGLPDLPLLERTRYRSDGHSLLGWRLLLPAILCIPAWLALGCNGTNGPYKGCLGEPCFSDSTCNAPYVCEDGTCVEHTGDEGGLDQPCFSDGTCNAPYVCEEGTCVQPSEDENAWLDEPCGEVVACHEPLLCDEGICVSPFPSDHGGLEEPCFSHDRCMAPYVCDEGTCRESTPFDVGVALEEESSTTALITHQGGVLETTDLDGVHYRMTFPEDAVPNPTEITLTPVSEIADFPFSGGLKAAAHLEPSGLNLFRPAILEITHDGHPQPGMAAGFSYYADGDNFHLRPLEYENDTVRFQILHFSGTGHGEGSAEERRDQAGQPAASQQQETDQALAEQLDDLVENQQQGNDRELHEAEQAAIFQILSAHYFSIVWPRAQQATQSREMIPCALIEYNSWSVTIDGFLGQLGIYASQLLNMREQAARQLALAFFEAINTVHMDCISNNDPTLAPEMLGWYQLFHLSRVAFDGGGSLDWSLVESRMKSCLRFELAFESSTWMEDQFFTTNVAISGLDRMVLELHEFPCPLTAFGEYKLYGENVLEYQDIEIECIQGWSGTPGQIQALVIPNLPALDMRSCPALPAFEFPSFRVYISSGQPPQAAITTMCPEDEEPFTIPSAPYWYGFWGAVFQDRLEMYHGFLFDEWTVSPSGNPIGLLDELGSIEEIQAQTQMELWHAPL